MAILFQGDDTGYLEWLDAHPTGYVMNLGRRSSELVLHRASCTSLQPRGTASELTERPKVCANTVANLRAYVRSHITDASDFSRRCSHCSPG